MNTTYLPMGGDWCSGFWEADLSTLRTAAAAECSRNDRFDFVTDDLPALYLTEKLSDWAGRRVNMVSTLLFEGSVGNHERRAVEMLD